MTATPSPPKRLHPGGARPFLWNCEETADDVALVGEIVDSRRDTAQKKLRVYGAAGLPEYWILDLRTRTLRVHREPHAKGYASVETYDEGATVATLERPDAPVAVADLLP